MVRGDCPTCGCCQDLEYLHEDEEGHEEENNRFVFCTVCGEEFPFSSSANDRIRNSCNNKYLNYKIGQIVTVEEIPKKKDLKKVLVNLSNSEEEDFIQIVTNAKYVEIGWKVVVALKDAIVPAGSKLDEDSNAMLVSPTSVGGVKSDGMICDSFMLGWNGGAKGVIQQMPDSYEIGTCPPDSRPRTE